VIQREQADLGQHKPGGAVYPLGGEQVRIDVAVGVTLGEESAVTETHEPMRNTLTGTIRVVDQHDSPGLGVGGAGPVEHDHVSDLHRRLHGPGEHHRGLQPQREREEHCGEQTHGEQDVHEGDDVRDCPPQAAQGGSR
jgi:hypothetical protein